LHEGDMDVDGHDLACEGDAAQRGVGHRVVEQRHHDPTMTAAVVVEQLGDEVDHHDGLAVGDPFEPRPEPREEGNVALGRSGRGDRDVVHSGLNPLSSSMAFSFTSWASA
jgi:hypothetical protein